MNWDGNPPLRIQDVRDECQIVIEKKADSLESAFCLSKLYLLEFSMIDNEEKRAKLVQELLEYFLKQNFEAIAVRNLKGYGEPEPIRNDGFGDQENKRPDILAFDSSQQCYLLGIVRTGENDLESEGSLTEYNVFLDQVDGKYGKPFRLYIIAPSNKINQLTSLITHYIHREYWHKITFVSSHRFEE